MTSAYLYIILSLTDFMGENLLRDKLGFALIILVVIIVGVNLIKALVVDSRWLFRKFKKFINKRYKKGRKEEVALSNEQIRAVDKSETADATRHNIN